MTGSRDPSDPAWIHAEIEATGVQLKPERVVYSLHIFFIRKAYSGQYHWFETCSEYCRKASSVEPLRYRLDL